MDNPTPNPYASSFSHLNGDVTPLFEFLEKLGGLLRAGDGLVIHPYDQVPRPQPHGYEDTLGRQFADREASRFSGSRKG